MNDRMHDGVTHQTPPLTVNATTGGYGAALPVGVALNSGRDRLHASMDGHLGDRLRTCARPPRGRSLARLRGLLWHRDEFRIYRYPLGDLPPSVCSEAPVIRRDHMPDLDLYEATAPWWVPRETFLATARERLAGGDHVYTVASNRRLLHYAWLADYCDATWVREVQQTFHYGVPGAVLYDAHTRPDARGRGLQSRSVAARLHDARALAGARWAYVGCLANNLASRAAIEKAGFTYYTSLHRMRVMGLVRRWQSATEP